MAVYTVSGHRRRIEAVFERAARIADLQQQADYARYLCVLISGFLEEATRHIYGNYARTKAHPNVARYVERRLSGFQNPKPGKLLELTGDLAQKWREDLEQFMEGKRHDHIDSVVANKNAIAHGSDVGVTYARAKEMFESVNEVVSFIEGQST